MGVIFFFFAFELLYFEILMVPSWGGGVEFVEFLILNNCILKSFHDPVLVGLLLSTIRSA